MAISFWLCVLGAGSTALLVCLAALDWTDVDSAGAVPDALLARAELPVETWVHWTTMRSR